jgi:capsular exopolysaccharide synthesis family protein
MSQIFDALLRSEVERTGNGAVTQPTATELLRSVERQTAPMSSSAVLVEQDEFANREEQRSIFDEVFDAPESTFAMPSVTCASIFGQFQSISVSPSSESRLVSLTDKESPTAESFRLLGVRLRDLRRTRSLKKMLITSTVPREGKSTVAANLACTLARKTGERTLLLEGDVRRPSQSQMLNLGSRPGLCELIQGKCGLSESIYFLENANLWILPAGNASDKPLDILQSAGLSKGLDQLASLFDWIIVDSPPVLPLADTSVWVRMVDGILLVAREGVTEKQQLERGLKALEPTKLLGALLNCSQASTYSSYYYRSSATT